jgi:hypothetical protein
MTFVQVRGKAGFFSVALRGRGEVRAAVDSEDVSIVAARRWRWHIRRGLYCAAEGVLLSRLILPKVAGRIVFANGDMADCRKRNLVAGCYLRRGGVWYDGERGDYVAAVMKGGVRVRVRCGSREAAERMRMRMALASLSELAAWRSGEVPEDLLWLRDDLAPAIARRCGNDAEEAARKGYAAGLRAAELLSARNMEALV